MLFSGAFHLDVSKTVPSLTWPEEDPE